MAQKTTLRHAFEAAKVTPETRSSPLVKRLVRHMERGAGIKTFQRRKPRTPQ